MSGEMGIDVIFKKKKNVRLPGIEPGSQAWKAHMITTTLGTLSNLNQIKKHILIICIVIHFYGL